jgi:CubicO group peptidase (beta-lactamase class C family)
MKKIILLPLIFFVLTCSAQKISLEQLLDSLEIIIQKEKIPGISLALVHKDSIIFHGGVGYAKLQDQEKVNADHLFRIGSVSKTFTSLAIMRLIERGKFSLDSKLKDIAPEIPFINQWEETHPVRVINLLEHTTGFDDMHFKDMKNYTGSKMHALDEVLSQKNSLYTRWRPSTRMSYSNPGYTILGYLITKYSGVDYRDFIAQEVLEPLHMHNSGFDYYMEPGYATGYYLDGTVHAIAEPLMINGEAAGAISSCAMDMARFIKFFLNNGRVEEQQIFASETLNQMKRSQSALGSQAGLYHGYGLALYTKPKSAHKKNISTRFIGHDGGIMGFVSDFGFNDDLGVGYFISNNAEKGNATIARLVTAFLIDNYEPELPQVIKIDQKALSEFQGFYRAENSRNQIMAFLDQLTVTATMQLKEDTLSIKAFAENAKKYVALSDRHFREIKRDYATVTFLHDGNKKVMMLGDTYYYQSSALYVWTLRVLMLLWITLGISMVIALIVWLIMWLTKNISLADFKVRIWPGLAFFSFCFAFFCFIDLTQLKNITTAAFINWRTLGVFLGTLLFAVFSVVGVWMLYKYHKNYKSKSLKIYLFASCALMLFAAIYFGVNDWIGLRMWAY